MDPTKVLAIVLAGGKGTRLHPLTAEHAKPALHLAAGYRIIDFVLSNLVNSGICSIFVLAQHKPQSLIEHIEGTWTHGPSRVAVIVAEGDCGNAFNGTADAVYRNLDLIDRHRPDLVAVFAADHVYRMDVRQMISFHEQHSAEVSVAAISVPIEQAPQLGVIVAARDGRIVEFQEKPVSPLPTPGNANRAYASMGNYVFNSQVLVELLDEAQRRGDTDFGSHIMPRLPERVSVFAYDFASNSISGIRPSEERAYWRDVGTLDAYRSAQLDVREPCPRFSLENPEWPIGRFRAPIDIPRSDGQKRLGELHVSEPFSCVPA